MYHVRAHLYTTAVVCALLEDKKESSFCAVLSFDRLYITYNLYLVVFLRHLISVTRLDTASVIAERLLLTFSVLSLPDVP